MKRMQHEDRPKKIPGAGYSSLRTFAAFFGFCCFRVFPARNARNAFKAALELYALLGENSGVEGMLDFFHLGNQVSGLD